MLPTRLTQVIHTCLCLLACVCVCACMRACVRACLRVCASARMTCVCRCLNGRYMQDSQVDRLQVNMESLSRAQACVFRAWMLGRDYLDVIGLVLNFAGLAVVMCVVMLCFDLDFCTRQCDVGGFAVPFGISGIRHRCNATFLFTCHRPQVASSGGPTHDPLHLVVGFLSCTPRTHHPPTSCHPYRYQLLPNMLSNDGEAVLSVFFAQAHTYYDYAARSGGSFYVEAAAAYFVGLLLVVIRLPITRTLDHCRRAAIVSQAIREQRELMKATTRSAAAALGSEQQVSISGPSASWATVQNLLLEAADDEGGGGASGGGRGGRKANAQQVASLSAADGIATTPAPALAPAFSTFKADKEISGYTPVLQLLSDDWEGVRFRFARATRNLAQTEAVLRAAERRLEAMLQAFADNAHQERERAAVVVQQLLAPHKAVYTLQMSAIACEPQFYVLVDSVSALAHACTAAPHVTDQNDLVFRRFGHKDWYIHQDAFARWRSAGDNVGRGRDDVETAAAAAGTGSGGGGDRHTGKATVVPASAAECVLVFCGWREFVRVRACGVCLAGRQPTG